MATILEKILHEKEKEVKKLKTTTDIPVKETANVKYSLLEKIEFSNNMLVISEFKRASPSKGIINVAIDPVEQAKLYEKNGASAISVLTDQQFFKGSFQDLQRIRRHVSLPILCKDFIISELQIDVAKRAGANIILLIAAALPYSRMKELFAYAIANQLEVIVEVHDRHEVAEALKLGAKMIGVNNRDLKTFQVDVGCTEQLAPQIISGGAYLISESGLSSRDDLKRVAAAGASAVLIGEALMKKKHVSDFFQVLSKKPDLSS